MGVVERRGADPARVVDLLRFWLFSLSVALIVSMRSWSMLSPCTRNGRPFSTSQAGIEVKSSCSS